MDKKEPKRISCKWCHKPFEYTNDQVIVHVDKAYGNGYNVRCPHCQRLTIAAK